MLLAVCVFQAGFKPAPICHIGTTVPPDSGVAASRGFALLTFILILPSLDLFRQSFGSFAAAIEPTFDPIDQSCDPIDRGCDATGRSCDAFDRGAH